jgi:hypothetical protein
MDTYISLSGQMVLNFVWRGGASKVTNIFSRFQFLIEAHVCIIQEKEKTFIIVTYTYIVQLYAYIPRVISEII